MTANDQPIELYHIEKPPVHIVHRGVFEEYEARVKAGLSAAEYDNLPGDPVWITEDTPQISKAHVIAYARMSSLIQAVYAEAQARKQKQNA